MKPNFQQIQMIKKMSGKNCKLRLNKVSIVQECEFCGNLYTPNHHRQKFCSDDCFKEHRRKYKRDWKNDKYNPRTGKLGTGGISEHRNKDFSRERNIVRNELRRIRL